jgi:hypothetical protein
MVDDLKAEGWPPERVIIAVKRVAEEAGIRTTHGVLSTTAPLTQQDMATVNAVRWCIQRYYSEETTRA